LAATTARPGPDYTAYRDWSNALVRADMEEIASSQRSPTGHKLTQWLAGPALPYALPQAISGDTIDVDLSMAVMGGVAALASAGLLVGMLRQLSSERAMTIFWFAAAWVATPVGYYLLAFSSETIALWMVVLLVGVLVGSLMDGERRPPALVVGLAAALLLMTRPYWFLYALPTLASVARRGIADGSRRRQVVAVLAVALPILAGCAQLMVVNRWTTGDFRRFAYLFGDAEFRSLDFGHPEWGAILWHPLRGLLVHHPAVALGVLAMLALIGRARSSGERVAWGSFAAIVAINVYVQASWFCWWQGAGITVGMRGLVPAAVPAIAALARLVQLVSSPIVRYAVILLVTLCGFWSWLMLPPGPTDYVTYEALFEGLRIEFDKMLDPRFFFLAMPGPFLLCAATVLFASRSDGKRQEYVPAACGATLVTLWAVYVWTQMMLGPDFFGWLHPKRDPFLAGSSPARQMAIGLAVGIAAAAGTGLLASFSLDWERLSRRLAAVVIPACFGLFGVAAFRIETGPTRIPSRPPTYPGKLYYVTEVEGCWGSYQGIPGFAEAKSRLRNFMIREGIPTDVTADPPPERNAEPAAEGNSDERHETSREN
jgi:hypothetical protein